MMGRLAQLGERSVHIAEVAGSSPAPPTIFKAQKATRVPMRMR